MPKGPGMKLTLAANAAVEKQMAANAAWIKLALLNEEQKGPWHLTMYCFILQLPREVLLQTLDAPSTTLEHWLAGVATPKPELRAKIVADLQTRALEEKDRVAQKFVQQFAIRVR